MYATPWPPPCAASDPVSRASGIFTAGSHRAALAALLGAVARRDPLAAIIGEAGVGKTTLVNAALPDHPGAHARILRADNPQGGALTAASIAAQILGRGVSAGPETDRALAGLVGAGGHAGRSVLIIDDAHTLTAEALRALLELRDSARGPAPLPMILVGRPGLREMLRQCGDAGRRVVSATLGPLSGAEARGYIRHCLALNGVAGEQVLSEAALLAIVSRSDGYPGRIDALLRQEGVVAAARGKADAATWLCEPRATAERKPGRAGRRLAGAAAGLAAVAGAAVLGANLLMQRHPLPAPAQHGRELVAVAARAVPPPVFRKRPAPQPLLQAQTALGGLRDQVDRTIGAAGLLIALAPAELRVLASPLEDVHLPRPIAALLQRSATGAGNPGGSPAVARLPPLPLLSLSVPPSAAGAWLDEAGLREPAGPSRAGAQVPTTVIHHMSAPEPAAAKTAPAPRRPHLTAVAARAGAGSFSRLVRDGDSRLVSGDVAAARPFYERAAADGSGAAATRLGKTYDPQFLAEIEADTIAPNRALAAAWYRRGMALGDAEARRRLQALTARPGG